MNAACPHCGTVKQRHGVFYYVFFGVVSLIATVAILSLGAVILGGALASSIAPTPKADYASSEQRRKAQQAKDRRTKDEYIANFLEVYSFDLRTRDSATDGKVAGLEFKLRNKGERTVDEIAVTVFFLDRDGKTVGEQTFYPILKGGYSGNSQPLKPGYCWQLERNKFYSLNNAPYEWAGPTRHEITDISFAKDP